MDYMAMVFLNAACRYESEGDWYMANHYFALAMRSASDEQWAVYRKVVKG